MPTGFDLVRVTWVDAHNNQGAWMTRDELAEFAADEAYRVTQVGYKVHEDELCIVLAARLSTPSPDYGQSFGMCERIPKKLIDSETLVEAADVSLVEQAIVDTIRDTGQRMFDAFGIARTMMAQP